MKYFFFLTIILFSVCPAYSQQDVFVGGSLSFGVPFNTFEQNRKVLGSGILSYHFNADLSVQYRVFNRLSFIGGASQHFQNWKLKDKDFEQRHPDHEVDIRLKNSYVALFGALEYAHPVEDYTYIYGRAGYAVNYTGDSYLTITKNFIQDNEDITVSSRYLSGNNSGFIEAGIETGGERGRFTIGLRMTMGRDNYLEGQYSAERNGESIAEDRFYSSGTNLRLKVGYKYNLFHKDKRTRTPASDVPDIRTERVVTEALDTLDQEVEGRILVLNNEVTVQNSTVILKVRDNQRVDGDRVSLNLNGEWILQNHTLEKDSYETEVQLKPGKNVLALHALNLGRFEPNTAALSVDDGEQIHNLVLESDMKSSGTLIIYYTP